MEEFDTTGRCHGKPDSRCRGWELLCRPLRSMLSWEHSASVGPEALRASKTVEASAAGATWSALPRSPRLERARRSLILFIALAQPWCWLPPSLPGVARAGEDLKHLLPVIGACLGAAPGMAKVNPKFAVWVPPFFFVLARIAIHNLHRRKKLLQGNGHS